MKKSPSELSLDQLDEVVGGASSAPSMAPMGLGASTPIPPRKNDYAFSLTATTAMEPASPAFGCGTHAAETAAETEAATDAAPDPADSPAESGCSPMGLGGSSAPAGDAPSAEAAAPSTSPQYAFDLTEDLVAMTIDDVGAPQGLGGNR